MHKNRIIIVLAVIIFLLPESGFTPSTKRFLIEFVSAVVVVLAFMIERKGVFSIWWSKKDTMTPVARTYVEHKGTASSAERSHTIQTDTTEDQ